MQGGMQIPRSSVGIFPSGARDIALLKNLSQDIPVGCTDLHIAFRLLPLPILPVLPVTIIASQPPEDDFPHHLWLP